METESTTPESRTYVVGLPVIVTVSPEGFLSVDVDLSDLGMSITREDESEHTDEQRAADGALADRWAEGHAVRNEGWVR